MTLVGRSLRWDPLQLLLNGELRRAFVAGMAPYKWRIAGLGLLVAGATLVPLVQPLLYRAVIDSIVLGVEFTALLPLAVAIAVAQMLGIGLAYWSTVDAAGLGRRMVRDLQNQAFGTLARMPLEFFTTVRSGAVGTRLTTDVNGTEPLFTKVVVASIANVLTLAGAGIVLFLIDARLAVLLLLIPAIFIPVKRTEQSINYGLRSQSQITTDVATTADAVLSTRGMTFARTSGRVADEAGRFGTLTATLQERSVALARFFARISALYELGFGGISTAVFLVGAWLATQGQVTVGTLILFVLYIRLVQGPVTALSSLRWEALRGAIAFERIHEIVTADPETRVPHAAGPRPAGPADPDGQDLPALRFDAVDFSYAPAERMEIPSLSRLSTGQPQDGQATPRDGRPVLREVSFQVRRGQMVALVGASGSGKSTIALLAAGLYTPSGGAVLLEGREVTGLDEDERARAVALISQDPYILHDTIRANLAYVKPGATDGEIMAACARARLGGLLDQLPDGLETIVGEQGYRLSGGERQRLAFARALLKDASLVILDEPTSQLDSETEEWIVQATEELFRDRAVLTIAHRLSTVRGADEVLVLAGGRIVEHGSPGDLLLRGGPFADLYRAQAG